MTTRLHYSTDLRALQDHAGNRLCTQAQFEWRAVWAQIVKAIREYPPTLAGMISYDQWQYTALSEVFKPVCYLTGQCEFKAKFDRDCSIRGRVDANEDAGREPSLWGTEYDVVEGNPIVSGVGPNSVVRNESGAPVFIGAIQPAEWLLNPDAAR